MQFIFVILWNTHRHAEARHLLVAEKEQRVRRVEKERRVFSVLIVLRGMRDQMRDLIKLHGQVVSLRI